MLFRRDQASEAVELTYAELRAMIREEDVPPEALVCDALLTQNQWWTIDNLRLYHQCSPVQHLPGTHLLVQDAARKVLEPDRARAMERREYDSPLRDFLGRPTAAPPISVWQDVPDVLGASRLSVKPNLLVLTLVFMPRWIELEMLFETYPPVPFGWQEDEEKRLGEVVVEECQLRYEDAPAPMSSWKQFLPTARDAGLEALDPRSPENSILHEVCDPEEPNGIVESYLWLPNPSGNRRCRALVNAYGECLEAAGLESPFEWLDLDSR